MITKFVVFFLTAEQKSNTVRTTNPHSLTLPPVPAYYKMGFLTTNPHSLTLPPVPAYYKMGFLTTNPHTLTLPPVPAYYTMGLSLIHI